MFKQVNMPRIGFILYLLGFMLFSASPAFAKSHKGLKEVEKLVAKQLLKDSSSDENKSSRYEGTNRDIHKCNSSGVELTVDAPADMLVDEITCYKRVAIALEAEMEKVRQWCSFLGDFESESLSKWHLYPDAQVKVRKCFDQTAYYPY